MMEGVDIGGYFLIGFVPVSVAGIVGLGLRLFVNMFREVIK